MSSSRDKVRRNVAMNRVRKRLKAKAIAYKGGACLRCGYNMSASALCFHHRDGSDKEFAISASVRSSWEILQRELDKCDLLCSNCHLEVHEEINEAKWTRLEAELSMPHITPGRTCMSCGAKFDADGWKKRCLACRGPSRRRLHVQEVVAAIAATSNVDEVAGLLHVSSSALYNFCKRNGIKYKTRIVVRPMWPTDADLARMVFEMPMVAIAKRLAVSSVSIGKRCRRLGIATPSRGYWTERRAA